MPDLRHADPQPPGLDPGLRERVLVRLGFASPPRLDPDGLVALHRAWTTRIPIDNVCKMIALRAEPPESPSDWPELPGIHAAEFFEAWLAHGPGGTCWPVGNASYELLRSVGFDARRVVGSMRDMGTLTHGTVKVRLDGRDWLVDAAVDAPLPLGPGVHMRRDSVSPAEVEAVDSTHLIWFDMPPNSAYIPLRLLMDPADHAFYRRGYEASRQRSPFNQRLYARRYRDGELIVLVGNTRFSRTAAGLASRDLSREELCRALRDDIGISEALIDQWARSGSLDASFEPPAGPKAPPITGKPPSQRTEPSHSGRES